MTEIWILSSELTMYNINGYTQYANCNDGYRSGGVIVFVKDGYAATSSALEIKSADTIKVTIKIESICLAVIAVYRLHSQTIPSFLDDINNVLNSSSDRNLLLIGDMNLCLLKQSPMLDRYLTILFSFGMEQLISSPTRGNSCLDHVFFRSRDNLEYSSFVSPSDRSDHDVIIFTVSTSPILNNLANNNPNERIKIDFERLSMVLQGVDWSPVFSSLDVDSSFTNFLGILKRSIGESLYVRKYYHSNISILKPWMTLELCKRHKFQKILYIKSKKRPNDRKFQRFFRSYSFKLKRDMNSQKVLYYQHIFENNKHDIKKQWRVINSVLGNQKKKSNISGVYSYCNKDIFVCDGQKIAEEFNNFFITVVNDLLQVTDSFDGLDLDAYERTFPSKLEPNSFFCTPTSSEEVLSIINTLHNNKSPGVDGVSPYVVKRVGHLISPVLSHIINSSIETGSFPSELKVALVVPLHKKGDSSELNNYRPISLLSVFSKIIEKIMKARVLNFLDSNRFFSDNQFGFIAKRSTEDALLNFCTTVYDGLNKNEHVSGIFIDITKAFDSVEHIILLDCLWKAGVRGTTFKWFKSYLCGRSQSVRFQNYLSSTLPIESGVPQGSVLGPILFLVYINSLCNGDLSGSLTCFADDTAICYSSVDNHLLQLEMQRDMDKIKLWFTKNKMLLSVKTKFMHFSLRDKPNPTQSLVFKCKSCTIIGGKTCNKCLQIDKVEHMKYLGLILDCKMSWKEHISRLKIYLYSSLRKFYFLQCKCPLSVLKTVYYSIVHSKLQYGVSCWGGVYQSTIYPITICQNKILRVMAKANRRDSSFPLYVYLGILPMRYIYIHKVLRIFFTRGGHLRGNVNVHSRRLQNLNRVPIPFPRLEAYRRFYTFTAAKLYNTLPINVTSSRSVSIFSRKVKSWLFSVDNLEQLLV